MFRVNSYIFATQKFLLSLFGMLVLIASASAEEEAALSQDMVNPGYHEKPDWFKNSFLDIREDIAEAKQAKKRVLLYFYQDGCPYCAKLLQDNLGQKKLADKTRRYFDVIAINMWGDREVTDLKGRQITEKEFAEQMRVMYTPTLVFLTENGRVALRVNGYYAPNKYEAALDYVHGQYERKLSFRDYLRKHIKPATSGKLHQADFILPPPYNLKKLLRQDKPLMILFEQKKCRDCDEMHNDIFKRKETLKQLRRFNIVRLDMWSKDMLVDPRGKKTSARAYARKLNVANAPSFIFLDKNGKVVFRIDAYLKAFHTQSVLDYVASAAYKTQPNFQRYISKRADRLEAQGVHIDLMK